MNELAEKVSAVIIAVIIVVTIAIIIAWPVQLLWNAALVGAVDGIHPIGFWQAMGINILASILFKPSTSDNSK